MIAVVQVGQPVTFMTGRLLGGSLLPALILRSFLGLPSPEVYEDPVEGLLTDPEAVQILIYEFRE